MRRRRLRVPRRRLVWLVFSLIVGGGIFGGGWFWLRDSQLVSVRDVAIKGVKWGPRARIEGALRSVALEMTTLHLRLHEIDEVARQFPSIAAVKTESHFPHRLTIHVRQREPVAVASFAGRHIPVAVDGTILSDIGPEPGLYQLEGSVSSSHGRITDKHQLETLRVVGAGPLELRDRISQAVSTARGITIKLRQGPDLIFGDSSAARAKWAAAVRVLADPTSVGASYLDLRVVGRVAVGGLAVEPSATSSSTTPSSPTTSPATPSSAVPRISTGSPPTSSRRLSQSQENAGEGVR